MWPEAGLGMWGRPDVVGVSGCVQGSTQGTWKSLGCSGLCPARRAGLGAGLGMTRCVHSGWALGAPPGEQGPRGCLVLCLALLWGPVGSGQSLQPRAPSVSPWQNWGLRQSQDGPALQLPARGVSRSPQGHDRGDGESCHSTPV